MIDDPKIIICLSCSIIWNYNLMHNYNPPHKYSLRTRIGNWSEEWDLQENKYLTFDSAVKSISAENKMAYQTSIKNNKYSPKATRA